MKINKHKKIACTLIAAASLLTLASCGGHVDTSQDKKDDTTSDKDVDLGDKRPEPEMIFGKLKSQNFTVNSLFNIIGTPKGTDEEHGAEVPNNARVITNYTKQGFEHKYLGALKDKEPNGYFVLDKDTKEHNKGIYKYNVSSVTETDEQGKEVKKKVVNVGDRLDGKTDLYDTFVTPYDLYKEADTFGKYFKDTNASEVNRITNETEEEQKYLVKLQKALNVEGLLSQIDGVHVVCCDLKYSATSEVFKFTFFMDYNSSKDLGEDAFKYSEKKKIEGEYLVAASVSLSNVSEEGETKVHLNDLEGYLDSLTPVVAESDGEEKGGSK